MTTVVYIDLLCVVSCIVSYLGRFPARKDFHLEDAIVFRKLPYIMSINLEVDPFSTLCSINWKIYSSREIRDSKKAACKQKLFSSKVSLKCLTFLLLFTDRLLET